jgi:hypothetical protein
MLRLAGEDAAVARFWWCETFKQGCARPMELNIQTAVVPYVGTLHAVVCILELAADILVAPGCTTGKHHTNCGELDPSASPTAYPNPLQAARPYQTCGT